VKDNWNVQLENVNTNATIHITDLQGREVYTSVIPAGETEWTTDLSFLDKGIYLYNVRSIGHVYEGKILKK
jgi:hypothetical protein